MPGEGEASGGYVDPNGPLSDKEVADWRDSVDAFVERPETQSVMNDAMTLLEHPDTQGDDVAAAIAERRNRIALPPITPPTPET